MTTELGSGKLLRCSTRSFISLPPSTSSPETQASSHPHLHLQRLATNCHGRSGVLYEQARWSPQTVVAVGIQCSLSRPTTSFTAWPARHGFRIVSADAHLLLQVAGAPGSLSMTYLPLATDMMGTPGTLRILLLRSRSFAAIGVSMTETKP